VPPELLARHRHGLQAFIGSGRDRVAIGHAKTLFGMRADGERFPFEAAVSRQGEGDRMTMTAVIRDLTDRRAAEAAREARIVAEAASQAKTEFLSRMSHELRTPLNAILGFAQLLTDDPREPLSPRQRHQLALTREAGWHLLALIDNVLDISRIEAGQLEMRFEAVSLKPLIESALSVSDSLAARHRVRLMPAPPTLDDGLAVRADATRLRQVVLNLLSNGCKYNRPGGRVAVEVALEPGAQGGSSHGAGMLRIDVVDDGVGMSEQQLAHLFEPFNRLGRESGTIEGTGIGLHLTRQLVQKMGGTITARSTPGQGTCMSVRLPRAEAGGAGHAAPMWLQPRRQSRRRARAPCSRGDPLHRGQPGEPAAGRAVPAALAGRAPARRRHRHGRPGAAAAASVSTSCCSTCSCPTCTAPRCCSGCRPSSCSTARRSSCCRPARCRRRWMPRWPPVRSSTGPSRWT
jgi:signal transduction histidine kinase